MSLTAEKARLAILPGRSRAALATAPRPMLQARRVGSSRLPRDTVMLSGSG